METSMCNTYFMSGEIKELKKKKKWNYSYILVDMIAMKYHYIGFFYIYFIKLSV